MTDKISKPVSDTYISMKGGGYYSQNTQGAKHVIDKAGAHVLEHCAETIVENNRRPFTIVDYGAADGGTSLDLVTKIIAEVRSRSAQREISVMYTDLPRNDFSALFKMLDGQVPELQSYLEKFDDVYVSSTGTSFYSQVLPSESVDLGFSATAMHWLSGVPVNITDHVHSVGASGAEWEAFSQYAQNDWETILVNRAKELVSGGLLVMANFCIDEEGRYLGNTRGRNMFDTFYKLWRELVETGIITEQECMNTTFPQFYKTLEEFQQPFGDPNSTVRRAGLQLETIYTGITDCPYRAEFERSGNSVEFANSYVPTLRSWSEGVFMGGLDASRPLEQRNRIVEEFYENYNSLVRKEPDQHAMDYVHVYMVVRKH